MCFKCNIFLSGQRNIWSMPMNIQTTDAIIIKCNTFSIGKIEYLYAQFIL